MSEKGEERKRNRMRDRKERKSLSEREGQRAMRRRTEESMER